MSREKKHAFLDQHVFHGLKDLNEGFDTPGIRYFSKEDFEIVLQRVKQLGIGIYGIEPWPDEEFAYVKGFDDYNLKADDPAWYERAFREFIADGITSHFSATYDIPDSLLKDSC